MPLGIPAMYYRFLASTAAAFSLSDGRPDPSVASAARGLRGAPGPGPGLSRVAVLRNSDVPGQSASLQGNRGRSPFATSPASIRRSVPAEDLDRAFSAVTNQRVQALVLPAGNPVAFGTRSRIASCAQRNRPSQCSEGNTCTLVRARRLRRGATLNVNSAGAQP